MRLASLFGLAAICFAQDYTTQIAPLLGQRCSACHGATVRMNGLRLDRRDDALRGGNSGPVIQPGKSAASKLIQMVEGRSEGKIMPPSGPRLTAAEVALLRSWIDRGAEWPVDKAADK